MQLVFKIETYEFYIINSLISLVVRNSPVQPVSYLIGHLCSWGCLMIVVSEPLLLDGAVIFLICGRLTLVWFEAFKIPLQVFQVIEGTRVVKQLTGFGSAEAYGNTLLRSFAQWSQLRHLVVVFNAACAFLSTRVVFVLKRT